MLRLWSHRLYNISVKPLLLLLTNQQNSDPQEDLFLANFLINKYQVSMVHPLKVNKYEDSVDIILVRNIWPTIDHLEEYRTMNRRFIQKNLKVYNSPLGSGDIVGKEYLIQLWKKGYPVIPTICNVNELHMLPTVDDYVTKPIYGGSGIGIQVVKRSELSEKRIHDCIIQPLTRFKQEISFYFIDGALQFALKTRDPSKRWELVPFQPTLEQIRIAQNFVEWNTLPYGIQRIDFGLTENGELLLMEIEDWCPYLSLLEIDEKARSSFLRNLMHALDRFVASGGPNGI